MRGGTKAAEPRIHSMRIGSGVPDPQKAPTCRHPNSTASAKKYAGTFMSGIYATDRPETKVGIPFHG